MLRRRLLPPRQGRQGLTWRAGKGRARGGWRLPPGLAESAIRDMIRARRPAQASESVGRPNASTDCVVRAIRVSRPSQSAASVA